MALARNRKASRPVARRGKRKSPRRRPVDGWKATRKTEGFMGKTPASARVKVGQDRDGYFCFRGRERSVSYPCQAMIPKMYIEFIADVYRKSGSCAKRGKPKRPTAKKTIG